MVFKTICIILDCSADLKAKLIYCVNN